MWPAILTRSKPCSVSLTCCQIAHAINMHAQMTWILTVPEQQAWSSMLACILQEAAFELERLNYASYQPANKSIRPRFCKKCQVEPVIGNDPSLFC